MDLLIKSEDKYYQLTGIEPHIEENTPYLYGIVKEDLGSFGGIRSLYGIVFEDLRVYSISQKSFEDEKMYEIYLSRNINRESKLKNLIKSMLYISNITIKGIYKRNKT